MDFKTDKMIRNFKATLAVGFDDFRKTLFKASDGTNTNEPEPKHINTLMNMLASNESQPVESRKNLLANLFQSLRENTENDIINIKLINILHFLVTRSQVRRLAAS